MLLCGGLEGVGGLHSPGRIREGSVVGFNIAMDGQRHQSLTKSAPLREDLQL
jgi:hypothetical protein